MARRPVSDVEPITPRGAFDLAMRIAWLLALLTILAAREAAACPPGPCLKYRRSAPVEAVVATYRRSVRALPPARFDRRRIEQFLTDSVWIPASVMATPIETLPAPTLRFVQPSRAARARLTERAVLVREVERRRGTIYVAVDGEYFALVRCTDEARRATTCLERAGALPEEDAEPSHRFATPP